MFMPFEAFPLEAIPAGTPIARLSGSDSVSASIADEPTIPVGSQQLKIIACGAVRAPQYQD